MAAAAAATAAGLRGYSSLTLKGQFSTAQETKIDMSKAYNGGSLPDHLLGLDGPAGGTSSFAHLAHDVQRRRAVENMLNDGVEDDVTFEVKSGGKPIIGAFKLGGKTYHSNEKGIVRITDEGKINRVLQIKQYRADRVDALMDRVLLGGTEICTYMFGVDAATWKRVCGKAMTAQDIADYDMDDELAKLNCNIEYIQSLPPSMTQTQSVAKLRKIVAHYERNVNIEGLTSAEDFNRNIRDGHNNPQNLIDPQKDPVG